MQGTVLVDIPFPDEPPLEQIYDDLLIGDVDTVAEKLAAELKAPVLGLYGAADQGIPVETVEKMAAACKAAGKTCEIKIYPDTPHGFNADYRPSYRPEAAKDGWAKMLAWFKQNGVG